MIQTDSILKHKTIFIEQEENEEYDKIEDKAERRGKNAVKLQAIETVKSIGEFT